MFSKLAATALLSLLSGLGLGYVLFRAKPPSTFSEADRCPSPPVNAAVPLRKTENIVTPAGLPAPPATKPAFTHSVSTPTCAPELETASVVPALSEKVKELERRLAIERAIRKGTEGERIEPPSNLPKRLRDENELLSAFSDALKAAGFPGQVTNIDCTEHPCIVFGTGFGDRDDMNELNGKLGPYNDDAFLTYGFVAADGRKEHRFFGVAVMPSLPEPPDESLRKRVTFRVNQMHEVSKPPTSL
jgi:hypothetical protein